MKDVERLHEREAARLFHLPADEGQWDGEGRGELVEQGGGMRTTCHYAAAWGLHSAASMPAT